MEVSWHNEARKMRGEGAKLEEVARKFSVSTERVRQVCVGVVCPIDHTAFFRDPEWRAIHVKKPEKRMEREAFLRAHYKQDMTAAEIGEALGITRNAVISSANGLGLCTPNLKGKVALALTNSGHVSRAA